MGNKFERSKSSLHAQAPSRYRGVDITPRANDGFSPGAQHNPTAGATIRAYSGNFAFGFKIMPRGERPGGASFHTLTA